MRLARRRPAAVRPSQPSKSARNLAPGPAWGWLEGRSEGRRAPRSPPATSRASGSQIFFASGGLNRPVLAEGSFGWDEIAGERKEIEPLHVYLAAILPGAGEQTFRDGAI